MADKPSDAGKAAESIFGKGAPLGDTAELVQFSLIGDLLQNLRELIQRIIETPSYAGFAIYKLQDIMEHYKAGTFASLHKGNEELISEYERISREGDKAFGILSDKGVKTYTALASVTTALALKIASTTQEINKQALALTQFTRLQDMAGGGGIFPGVGSPASMNAANMRMSYFHTLHALGPEVANRQQQLYQLLMQFTSPQERTDISQTLAALSAGLGISPERIYEELSSRYGAGGGLTAGTFATVLNNLYSLYTGGQLGRGLAPEQMELFFTGARALEKAGVAGAGGQSYAMMQKFMQGTRDYTTAQQRELFEAVQGLYSTMRSNAGLQDIAGILVGTAATLKLPQYQKMTAQQLRSKIYGDPLEALMVISDIMDALHDKSHAGSLSKVPPATLIKLQNIPGLNQIFNNSELYAKYAGISKHIIPTESPGYQKYTDLSPTTSPDQIDQSLQNIIKTSVTWDEKARGSFGQFTTFLGKNVPLEISYALALAAILQGTRLISSRASAIAKAAVTRFGEAMARGAFGEKGLWEDVAKASTRAGYAGWESTATGGSFKYAGAEYKIFDKGKLLAEGAEDFSKTTEGIVAEGASVFSNMSKFLKSTGKLFKFLGGVFKMVPYAGAGIETIEGLDNLLSGKSEDSLRNFLNAAEYILSAVAPQFGIPLVVTDWLFQATNKGPGPGTSYAQDIRRWEKYYHPIAPDSGSIINNILSKPSDIPSSFPSVYAPAASTAVPGPGQNASQVPVLSPEKKLGMGGEAGNLGGTGIDLKITINGNYYGSTTLKPQQNNIVNVTVGSVLGIPVT